MPKQQCKTEVNFTVNTIPIREDFPDDKKGRIYGEDIDIFMRFTNSAHNLSTMVSE